MLEKDNESIITYDSNQKYLYQIPPKHGRYIVLDVETTGWKKEDHVIEIGAHELKNGALTGDEFHVLIKSRVFKVYFSTSFYNRNTWLFLQSFI